MTAAERRTFIMALLNQGVSPETIARCADGVTRDDVLAVLDECERETTAITDAAKGVDHGVV